MTGFSIRPGWALGAVGLIVSSSAFAAALPSRAPAVPAAKAEAAVPVCAHPPLSGEKLAGDLETGGDGHDIRIENGAVGDALIKIRYADTGKLAASYYLRKLEKMALQGVPDGTYVIQYALGPSLAADCKSLTKIIRASQMPDEDDMRTQVTDDSDKTEVKRTSIVYQLSVTRVPNVKPVRIDAAMFNAE